MFLSYSLDGCEYIIKHRHEDPNIQNAYDKRFWLALRS